MSTDEAASPPPAQAKLLKSVATTTWHVPARDPRAGAALFSPFFLRAGAQPAPKGALAAHAGPLPGPTGTKQKLQFRTHNSPAC